MSQQCYECGRESSLGQPLQHWPGCEHRPWDMQAWPAGHKTHNEYLSGPFAVLASKTQEESNGE